MPTGAFNICCPRDCVSLHNGGTLGAPLKPLRVDSALRALSTLRGLRGAPGVPPLCRETQSLGQQMLNAPVGINGLTPLPGYLVIRHVQIYRKCSESIDDLLRSINNSTKIKIIGKNKNKFCRTNRIVG